VCGIDVGCVAEVVGVLEECLWVSEDRRVGLEVVRPRPHGLEDAAQGVCGRTHEGVDLAGFLRLLDNTLPQQITRG
jgi:hypothetical protein